MFLQPQVDTCDDPYFSDVSLSAPLRSDYLDVSNNGVILTRAGYALPSIYDYYLYNFDGHAICSIPSNSTGNAASHFCGQLPFALGTDQFTIECYVIRNSVLGSFIDFRADSGFTSTTDGAGKFYIGQASSEACFSYGATPTTVLGSSYIAEGDTWHYVAVTRDASNNLRLFVNGTLENTATVADDFSNPYFTLGNPISTTFRGYTFVSSFRITKGVCRYTDSFTKPTTPYPAPIRTPRSLIEPVLQFPHSTLLTARTGL